MFYPDLIKDVIKNEYCQGDYGLFLANLERVKLFFSRCNCVDGKTEIATPDYLGCNIPGPQENSCGPGDFNKFLVLFCWYQQNRLTCDDAQAPPNRQEPEATWLPAPGGTGA